jgi:UDP:flavonoid glycosyltransferase YjiC (YdhE family)
MKFALAAHGSRGDVEPCAAVGLELLCRGRDVRIAVPPNLVGFVEAAGVAYGPGYIGLSVCVPATSGRVSSATPGGSRI